MEEREWNQAFLLCSHFVDFVFPFEKYTRYDRGVKYNSIRRVEMSITDKPRHEVLDSRVTQHLK